MNALKMMTNTNTHYVVKFGGRQCNIYGRIFKRNINNKRGACVMNEGTQNTHIYLATLCSCIVIIPQHEDEFCQQT